jgi:sulfate permease, SulP family
MDGVSILDAGGLAALNKFVDQCRKQGIRVLIADLQFQPLKTLARAGVQPIPGVLAFYPTLREALDALGEEQKAPQEQSLPAKLGAGAPEQAPG